MATAATDYEDLIVNHVDPLDLGWSAEDLDLEGHLEPLFEHSEKSDTLLVVAVGIDNRFGDQRVKRPRAGRPLPPRYLWTWCDLRAVHAARSTAALPLPSRP